MRAYVLYSGEVVRFNFIASKTRESLTTGFLIAFSILDPISFEEKAYVHVYQSDLMSITDSMNFDAGYYPREDFINYKFTDQIEPLRGKRFSDWKLAEEGDEIVVRHVVSRLIDGLIVPKIAKFVLTYNDSFIDDFLQKKIQNTIENGRVEVTIYPKRIIIPEEYNAVYENITSNITAIEFGSVQSEIINNSIVFDEESIRGAIKMIGFCMVVITYFEEDVFSHYPNMPPHDLTPNLNYETLANHQKNYWKTALFTEASTMDDVLDFYTSTRILYNAAYGSLILVPISPISSSNFVFYLMGFTPSALSGIPIKYRIKIIKSLINDGLSKFKEEIWTENFVINIIISVTYSNDVDEFMDWLQSLPLNGMDKGKTYYEILYNRMSVDTNLIEGTKLLSNWIFETNWEVDNTKDLFAKTVYKLWVISKYNPYDSVDDSLKENTFGMKAKNADGIVGYEVEPADGVVNSEVTIQTEEPMPKKLYYYTRYSAYDRGIYEILNSNDIIDNPDASPIIIDYQSKRNVGIYFDNFNFEFKNDTIRVIKKHKTNDSAGFLTEWKLEYGIYRLFQPVSILDNNIDTITRIPLVRGEEIEMDGGNINTLVPIFLLAHADMAGDRSDTEKFLGYVVDALLTFTGIGNLGKYRHVTKLNYLHKVKRFIGGVEFVSGVTGFMSNFLCDDDSEFCKKLNAFLFWIEMATLSTDVVTSRMLKKTARDIKSTDYPSDFNDTETLNAIDTASAFNKLEEIDSFITYRLGNNYPNFRLKLELLRDTNPDVAFELVFGLKNYDDIDIYKLLNENPAWIDDIVDINSAGRFVKTLDILPEISVSLSKRIEHQTFNLDFFQTQFSLDNQKELIYFVIDLDFDPIELGFTVKNMVEDLMLFSCRNKKLSSMDDLLVKLQYFKNVTLVKGFVAGFASLENYKLFCNKTRNYFESIPLFSGKVIEYRIQGSTLTNRAPDIDPIDISNTPFLPNKPNDLDVDLLMEFKDAVKIKNDNIKYWSDKIDGLKVEDKRLITYEKKIKDIETGFNNGMLHQRMVFETSPWDVFHGWKEARKHNGSELFEIVNVEKNMILISFSIIIKGGKRDVLPTFPFKY